MRINLDKINKIYLAKVHRRALLYLYEQPLTSMAMSVTVFRTSSTLDSLCENGLAKWFPYGSGEEGCWKITLSGKEFVELYLTEYLVSNE